MYQEDTGRHPFMSSVVYVRFYYSSTQCFVKALSLYIKHALTTSGIPLLTGLHSVWFLLVFSRQ